MSRPPLAGIVGSAVVFQGAAALHFFGKEQLQELIGFLQGGAVGGHGAIVADIGHDGAVLGGERRRHQLLVLGVSYV